MNDKEILTKINAQIVIKGIELQTLMKLRNELTKPKTPPPKKETSKPKK